MNHSLLAILYAALLLFSCSATAEPGAVQEVEDNRINIHGIDSNLRDAIAEAGEKTESTYALDKNVQGKFTAFLYSISFEQAIEYLLPHAEARWYHKEGIIHIVSDERYRQNADRGLIENQEENQAEKEDQNPVHQAEPGPAAEPDDQHRMELNVKELQIASVLQLLSLQTKQNMIVSNQVSGNVTLRLKNVSFDQALDHILTVNGWHRIDMQGYIWIISDQEWEELHKDKAN